MIGLDTSGLLAAIDSGQRLHLPAKEVLENIAGPLLISPFVLAELDYLLATRVAGTPNSPLLGEVARGAYRLGPFSADNVTKAAGLIERYAGFADLSLADASSVVLANRYETYDILTLDERHFRAVEGPRGRPFRIPSADS